MESQVKMGVVSVGRVKRGQLDGRRQRERAGAVRKQYGMHYGGPKLT